jgi:hypothetical protein
MAQWALTYYQFVAGILLTVTPLLRNKPAACKHRRARRPGPPVGANRHRLRHQPARRQGHGLQAGQ